MTQTTSQVEAAAERIQNITDHYVLAVQQDPLAQIGVARRQFEVALRAELASQQEVAAPVGVVSVSPLHVGVGWVGGYVPKNGEKLYLAAARVPVASPAEPVAWRRKEDGGWWVYYETKAHDDLEPLYGGAGVMDARPDSVHSDSGECGRVQRVELSGDELALFQRTLDGFADCGETETGYETLVNWARRGLLECTNFRPTAAAHRMLATSTSTEQKGGAA